MDERTGPVSRFRLEMTRIRDRERATPFDPHPLIGEAQDWLEANPSLIDFSGNGHFVMDMQTALARLERERDAALRKIKSALTCALRYPDDPDRTFYAVLDALTPAATESEKMYTNEPPA